MKLPAHLSLRSAAIAGITLLALALGGSTELWAQAVIALLVAVQILLYPPRVALGILPTGLLLVFMGLALAAFLPAEWGLLPEWRRHLAMDLHAPLGDLRTPQPWLTLQACGLLLIGLVWTYYLFAQEWSPAERSQTLRLFAAGVILLGAFAVVAYRTGYRVPGWTQEENRGWFPNRNQTADVLALAGIITYVVGFKRLEKKEWSGILWFAGLAVLGGALVVSYSRSGVLMIFCGIGFWHLGSLFRPHGGKKMALGAAAILLLLSLFLLFGGTTLERFLDVAEPVNVSESDYRVLIQVDALRVSMHAPVLGVGLGNFEPIFTSMRVDSADQNRTLHPESDWLWMAVEMGWLAPLLAAAGVSWWLRQCLPVVLKSGEALRLAAMMATLMFVAHSFVDVSGHRLGSFLVGILMAALSLSPFRRITSRRWISPLFRGLALIVGLVGTWWLASFYSDQVPSTTMTLPPTTATLERLRGRVDLAASQGKLASMGEAASAALDLAPLDWTFYFRRASAEAFRNGAATQASDDFACARYLEPNWIDLCLNEGEVWLAADAPDPCLDAWREALRRAGTDGTATYATMLSLSQNNSVVHAGLADFADQNIDYLITFLNYATPDEEEVALKKLLARDPTLHLLGSDQQRKLFTAWYLHGNQDELAHGLLTNVDWQVSGWRFLADYMAQKQDFELATMTALRHLAPPTLPPSPSEQPLSVMESHFDNHPDDMAEGLMLCQAQIEAGRLDETLHTISVLEKNPDCPGYIFYFEAQVYVKKKQWDSAWEAVQKFEAK